MSRRDVSAIAEAMQRVAEGKFAASMVRPADREQAVDVTHAMLSEAALRGVDPRVTLMALIAAISLVIERLDVDPLVARRVVQKAIEGWPDDQVPPRHG